MKISKSGEVWFGWLFNFFVLEFLALFRDNTGVKWVTLSEYCWGLEDEYRVYRVAFVLLFVGLILHIVFKWPER